MELEIEFTIYVINCSRNGLRSTGKRSHWLAIWQKGQWRNFSHLLPSFHFHASISESFNYLFHIFAHRLINIQIRHYFEYKNTFEDVSKYSIKFHHIFSVNL